MFIDLALWLSATSLIGLFGLPLINKVYSKDVNFLNYSLSFPFFFNNKWFNFVVNFFNFKKLSYL